MGICIATLLKCSVTDETQTGRLWNVVQSSVPKYLDSKLEPNKLLEELIISYNNAESRKERLKILSFIVNEYKYPFIRQFNAEYTVFYRQQVADVEVDKYSTINLMIPPEVKFNPPVTEKTWHKARLLYAQFGYGGGNVPETKIRRWKFSPEVIDSIIGEFSSLEFIIIDIHTTE